MPSIRDIFVQLGMKTDGPGFKNADNAINKVRESALSLGRVLLTGAVAVGFKKMIDVASSMEETANKFGAVFGEAGAGVQTQLDDIAKRTGATNAELQAMSSNIGALIKPALGSAEAAGDLASQVTELALDISSFNNVTSEDAIVALRSGLIGSAEPLQRFGVDVRNSALELEAQRQGLKKSFKEMTEGEKTMLRFAAIQRQLGEQGATGDATRTAKGFANASRNLRAAIVEVAGTIGTFLLKYVSRFVNVTREAVDSVKSWITENKALIQQRIDKFVERTGRVIDAVRVFVGRIVDATKAWFDSLGPVGQQILKITGIVLGLVAVLMLPGVPLLLLAAIIGLLIEDFETWRRGGDSLTGDLISWFKSLISTVTEFANSIKMAFQLYVDSINSSIDSFKQWLKDNETGISLVTSLALGLALVIGVGWVKANSAAIASFLITKATAIASFFAIKAAAVVAWVSSSAVAIASFVATKVAAIASAVASGAAWLAATLPLILTAVLLGVIVGVLIFLGRELVKLALGQENFFSTMSEGISGLIEEWGGVGAAIGAMLDEALRFWLEFFGLSENEVDEWIDNLTDTLQDFWKNVTDFWKGIASDFLSWLLGKLKNLVPSFLLRDDTLTAETKKRVQEEQGGGAVTSPRGAVASPRTAPSPQLSTLQSEMPLTQESQIIRDEASFMQTISPVMTPTASIAVPGASSSMQVMNDNSTSNVQVEVNASPGMDEQKLAELIPKEIARAREAENRQAARAFALGVP